MDAKSVLDAATNSLSKGFGQYAITKLPLEGNISFSETTLNELWAAYRSEHEDLFTNIVHLPTELRSLNCSERFFRDRPQLCPIFDYWKDRLLFHELSDMLSPESLISWESLESAPFDMFCDMLEDEFEIGDSDCPPDDFLSEEYDPSCIDVDRDMDRMQSFMHIISPFIFLMMRYSFFQTWLQKTIASDDFRHNRACAGYLLKNKGLRLAELHDINMGGYPAKRIYSRFATMFARAMRAYMEAHPRAIDDANTEVITYISMANVEVARLGQDECLLRKHCHPFFVDSLIEWHRGYFAYLIHLIHQFKGYENYQVPNYRVTEVKKKPKVIDENRALTQLGKSCRRAVVKKIQDCRTAADYGKLLYQLQFVYKYLTPNLLSRNDYYLFMQQIAQVKFCPTGDFSNCNKGFQAAMEASRE